MQMGGGGASQKNQRRITLESNHKAFSGVTHSFSASIVILAQVFLLSSIRVVKQLKEDKKQVSGMD